MRNECDNTEWLKSAEVEHLTLFSTEPHAIVAIGDMDSVTPWQIGRAAGFSGGTRTDEATRRSNWASAASKATKLNKKTLPHIAALRERLAQFRSDGGDPKSISWKDKLDRCEWLIQYGTPSESLRAVELHNKMAGKGDSGSSRLGQIISQMIADVGLERVRRGFEELGYGSLKHKYPDLLLEQKTLENDNEESGPAEWRAGDDPRNLASGGARRVSDDAAGEMDRGPKITGGADPGERSDGSRDIAGRLSKLEKLEVPRKLQEARS